jgi:predicted Rossmann fold nucleotide-binding protein DprA/Smf involved in DNA uptake
LSEGVQLSEEQRLDWLRLIRSDNVGPRTFRELVNYYGGARAALAALPGLARRGGASGPARICSQEAAAAELKTARGRGIKFVALGEPDYPPRLQMIDDPPPLIAVLEPILGRGLDLPAQEPAQETPGPLETEPGEDERSRIIALMGPTPAAIDDLVRLSQSSPAIVRTVLLELEIAGRLERHGGGLISLL